MIPNTLFISDMHMPYHHPDSFNFLEAVRDHFEIECIKSVGDMDDHHSSSFHPLEYGALSAKEEHERTKEAVHELKELFPEMTIVRSNHGDIPQRKAREAGLSLDCIKNFNELYEIDNKWKVVDHDMFKVSSTQKCLMVHQMSSSTLNNAKVHSHCTVQGHHHGTAGIEYFADTDHLRWSMTVGCLIDFHSPAFNYSKLSTKGKPIISVGVLQGEVPLIVPMRLKRNGRWDYTI